MTDVRAVGAAPGIRPCGDEERAGRRRVVDHGSLPFLIRRDGSWLYRGTPIDRKELVCLFSSVLTRDRDGRYWIETPSERGMIEVEDTPWLAVELDWCGSGRNQVLSFRTNVDQVVVAGGDHPLRIAHDRSSCSSAPYLHVREGEGTAPLEARIARPVYYELVALGVDGCCDGRACFGVWSGGHFFRIGDTGAHEV